MNEGHQEPKRNPIEIGCGIAIALFGLAMAVGGLVLEVLLKIGGRP